MAEQVQLKDSERQPCEVWTRVMGYHRPVRCLDSINGLQRCCPCTCNSFRD